MKLNALAAKLFTYYSTIETGRPGNWAYLSAPRKLEWMREVMTVAHHVQSEIKTKLKPLPKPTGNTSYEMGYQLGLHSERVYTNNLLEEIFAELEKEFEEFESKLDKK